MLPLSDSKTEKLGKYDKLIPFSGVKHTGMVQNSFEMQCLTHKATLRTCTMHFVMKKVKLVWFHNNKRNKSVSLNLENNVLADTGTKQKYCTETQLFQTGTDRSINSIQVCWFWHFFFFLLFSLKIGRINTQLIRCGPRIYVGGDTNIRVATKPTANMRCVCLAGAHTDTQMRVAFGPPCGVYVREVALLGAPGCAQTVVTE